MDVVLSEAHRIKNLEKPSGLNCFLESIYKLTIQQKTMIQRNENSQTKLSYVKLQLSVTREQEQFGEQLTMWNGKAELGQPGTGTGTPHHSIDVFINLLHMCNCLGKRHNKEGASNYPLAW